MVLFDLYSYRYLRRKKCMMCGSESALISESLGLCVECIRGGSAEVMEVVKSYHRFIRNEIGLPEVVPEAHDGVQCNVCGNRCKIPSGGRGYCGIMYNDAGTLRPITGSYESVPGFVYYDELPTNCVARWICPGCTGRGYPKYAYSDGPEYGYYNIAVFYGSCNFDCLFCQNWEYRILAVERRPLLSVSQLVAKVNRRTSCVCYFGGDPGPNMIHALHSSREMMKKANEIGMRIFRICWETNGLMNPNILDKAVELSIESGGCIKVDVKAWSPSVYYALCGNDGRLVFENIRRIAKRIEERPDPPLLIISTLLVPGYVDYEEVRGISEYIAKLNPDIPFTLLAFHPKYKLLDLPTTSKSHALNSLRIAKEAGLKHVDIGNFWLLSDAY